jgi:hypothetical protein
MMGSRSVNRLHLCEPSCLRRMYGMAFCPRPRPHGVAVHDTTPNKGGMSDETSKPSLPPGSLNLVEGWKPESDYTVPGAGQGGVAPPTRFAKGNTAAKGPRNAGKLVRNAISHLMRKGLTQEQLQQLMRARFVRPVTVIAANILLQACERPDMADLEPVLEDGLTLQEARARGFNTNAIQKYSISSKGRGITLFDRSRQATELVIHETDGQPTQTINMGVSAPPVVVVIGLPAGLHGMDELFPPPDTTEAKRMLGAGPDTPYSIQQIQSIVDQDVSSLLPDVAPSGDEEAENED